jgi:competence protein ComGC
MKFALILLLLPFLAFSQTDAEKQYEKAVYEMSQSNRQAYSADIQYKVALSEIEKENIISTYLQKEGVFKVEFTADNSAIRIYYFEPVMYEIVEDLARLFFFEFLVTKPKMVGLRNGALFVVE